MLTTKTELKMNISEKALPIAKSKDDQNAFSQKILIVDDQSFNIEALKIILKYKLGVDSST
jgi:PleD family two-component response regulator